MVGGNWSETLAEDVAVYGRRCLGCQRHNREVMLTIQDSNDAKVCKFHDVFFTREQAELLLAKLTERLAQNDEGDDE